MSTTEGRGEHLEIAFPSNLFTPDGRYDPTRAVRPSASVIAAEKEKYGEEGVSWDGDHQNVGLGIFVGDPDPTGSLTYATIDAIRTLSAGLAAEMKNK